MHVSALLPTAAFTISSAVLAMGGVAQAAPDPVIGHVYQPTNDAAGNAVAVYDRYADGSLAPDGWVATGGLGTGASLGSQGAIARDGGLLFVVNAGDDTISALSIKGDSVALSDRISSGGDRPVSITVSNGVGYVLNHDSDTIDGFTYDRSGDLAPCPAPSARSPPTPPVGSPTPPRWSSAPTAAPSSSPRGRPTHRHVHRPGGDVGQATSHESAGTVPYGFDFDRRGTLVVSEAATGSASSYRVAPASGTSPRRCRHPGCRVLAGGFG